MNGDLLCDLDYRAFLEHHARSGNEITVSTYKRSVNSDFGVLQSGRRRGGGFEEKPVFHFDVSMGVYCISRSVIDRLEEGAPYGFDNLMVDGIRDGLRLEALPFDGFWLDIGRPRVTELADKEFARLKEQWNL